MVDPVARGTLVWDLPTRLFHWLLVLAIAGCWWTGERGPIETHALLGYGVLGLLLFRIAWGLVGSETARFASFVRGPAAAAAYVRHLLGRPPLDHPVGHNPLGGWSVLLLLLVLLVSAATGLFLYDDEIYWAPLNHWVGEESEVTLSLVHDIAFDLLLVLVAVHVAAILLYLVARGTNLIGPMLTGRAELPRGAAAPRIASLPLALLLAAAAAFAVWALIRFAGSAY